MANGNTFDRQGRLLSCEHANSRLVRCEADGSLTVLASHFEGSELNSPNDVVVDSARRIYFTDPSYGRTHELVGVKRPQQLSWQGVYRLDPDGRLTLLADDFQQPNGLCLDRQERHLYVNDTLGRHIRRWTLDAEGNAAGGDIWVSLRSPRKPPTSLGATMTCARFMSPLPALCTGSGWPHRAWPCSDQP